MVMRVLAAAARMPGGLQRTVMRLVRYGDPVISPEELRERLECHEMPPGITVDMLLALAWGESRFNPRDLTGSQYRGLWQVPTEAVRDYNRRNGAKLLPWRMHFINDSILVALDHFRAISNSLRSAVDIDHPDWVGFAFSAHNAGYSRLRGLAGVLRRAQAAGEIISFDRIPEMARRHNGVRHLYNRAKVRYWRRLLQKHDEFRGRL